MNRFCVVLMFLVPVFALGCAEEDVEDPCVTGSTNLLADGEFAQGLKCIIASQGGQIGLGFSFVDDHPPQTQAPALKVVNNTLGNAAFDTQLVSRQFFLQSGSTYSIAFWARADEARTVDIYVQACCAVSIQFFTERVALTTEWQLIERTFTAGSTSNEAYFELQFGEVSTAAVYVDGVVVKAL